MGNNWWRHRFRRTSLLSVLCLSFLLGMGLLAKRAGALPAAWLIVTAPAIVFFRHKTWLAVVAAIALGGTIGWWRGGIYVQKLNAYAPYYEQKVTLQVTAANDAVYGKHSQLTFDANHIRAPDGTPLAGKLEVSGFGENAVYQGDTLLVSGKLYSGLGQYQGFVSYADLQVIAHHTSFIDTLRRRFTAGMQTALPEPLASFAMGLLIGQRATLPDNVKQDLLMVGLTHIIAVSGYNLTIILNASQRLLGKRSKRMSTGVTLALMAGFLLLAGASASIVRAAIISVLSLSAHYYGRQVRPLLLILLGAAITAWLNPFYVWSDTSWYLSFLAFYGVLVIAPLLSVEWRWAKSLLGGVALETLCAEIMTLPYVLFVFGQMSFIGLPANVLVTTMVPLAMLLSAVAGLAGMVALPVAGWLAWPARFLLTYMLDTAHLLAHVPHVFLQNLAFPLQQLVFAYGAVACFTLLLWFKRPKNGTITEKEAIDSS